MGPPGWWGPGLLLLFTFSSVLSQDWELSSNHVPYPKVPLKFPTAAEAALVLSMGHSPSPCG